MTAPYTHPELQCWICLEHPASRVVEAKALAPYASSPDEIESYYQLCCTHLVCLGLSALWASAHDSVHVDTYPIRSRAEAEAISGLQLDEEPVR